MKIARFLILAAVLGLGFCNSAFCQATDISGLVDSFQAATDLQREQILKDTLEKEFSCGGAVANVGEYDFFDVTNDIKGIYYQVTTEVQKTANNVPYQLIFLFNDRKKVQDINKGQSFQNSGKIIRIMDERLQIAVWLYCGDLNDKDKALFNQTIYPAS